MKEFSNIREWAKDKGILDKATPETQFLKLAEEVGELANALAKKDQIELIDAIGDCIVVLTILAEMKGVPVEECIESAWGVISSRTGKMVNGVFVKDKK